MEFQEPIKRPGMEYVRDCTGDETWLIQQDGKVYAIDCDKGIPQVMADCTERKI